MHIISHYIDSILRGGIPAEYNADMWEHTHMRNIKWPFRVSNRRNAGDQVAATLDKMDAATNCIVDAAEGRKYDTIMRNIFHLSNTAF